MWCVGWCCQGRGSRARHGEGGGGEKVVRRTTRGLWAAVFRDNAAVRQAVLLRERRQCGSAMDDTGRCSGVFVFYLQMGMGKIHWNEEVDPIIIIE